MQPIVMLLLDIYISFWVTSFTFFSQCLEEAHKNYIEMKTKLQETGSISSDRSVNAISNDLIPDIARYSTQPISNGHLYALQYIEGYTNLCDNNELFYQYYFFFLLF